MIPRVTCPTECSGFTWRKQLSIDSPSRYGSITTASSAAAASADNGSTRRRQVERLDRRRRDWTDVGSRAGNLFEQVPRQMQETPRRGRPLQRVDIRQRAQSRNAGLSAELAAEPEREVIADE